jgi:hypothetical protein
MTNQAKKKAQIIAPDAYPQMMSRADSARALLSLRGDKTLARAQVAMESAAAPMRIAILGYVAEMEAACQDMDLVFAHVHEIRGFAETAGMASTGHIAEILCRYMEDMRRIEKPLDAHIVALHVAAIARAARAEEDDVAMGEVVAAELGALVARRLVEAQKG